MGKRTGVRTHTTTSIHLGERQLDRLNELAEQTGLSTSAVMRLLIDNSRVGRVTRDEPVSHISGQQRRRTRDAQLNRTDE